MLKNKRRIIWGLLIIILLISIDQLTKWIAQTCLASGVGVPVISGVFEFYYLKNPGAAFGIFSNKMLLFAFVTIIFTILISYYYLKSPNEKKFNYFRFICLLIISGGIGNMIDRFVHGFVVDFLYFKLIDFPVFNLADVYVCTGAVIGLLLLFFYYSEEDLSFFSFKRNKAK